MFITVLFITEKTQQWLRYSSVGEWVNTHCSGPDDGILFSTKRKWANKPWKDTEET